MWEPKKDAWGQLSPVRYLDREEGERLVEEAEARKRAPIESAQALSATGPGLVDIVKTLRAE